MITIFYFITIDSTKFVKLIDFSKGHFKIIHFRKMSKVTWFAQLYVLEQTMAPFNVCVSGTYYCAEKERLRVYFAVMKANNVCNIQVDVPVSLFSTSQISISGSMTNKQ